MLVVDVCDVGALAEPIALVTAPSTEPVMDGFLTAASIKPVIPVVTPPVPRPVPPPIFMPVPPPVVNPVPVPPVVRP